MMLFCGANSLVMVFDDDAFSVSKLNWLVIYSFFFVAIGVVVRLVLSCRLVFTSLLCILMFFPVRIPPLPPLPFIILGRTPLEGRDSSQLGSKEGPRRSDRCCLFRW